jgi:hypothetical protein
MNRDTVTRDSHAPVVGVRRSAKNANCNRIPTTVTNVGQLITESRFARWDTNPRILQYVVLQIRHISAQIFVFVVVSTNFFSGGPLGRAETGAGQSSEGDVCTMRVVRGKWHKIGAAQREQEGETCVRCTYGGKTRRPGAGTSEDKGTCIEKAPFFAHSPRMHSFCDGAWKGRASFFEDGQKPPLLLIPLLLLLPKLSRVL